MADQIIQIPVDSTGKKIDCSELTVGANTVERQRIVIGDPTTAASLATVKSNGSLLVQGYSPSVTTGSITSSTSTVGPVSCDGINIVTIGVTGTYAGVTFVIEASHDGGSTFPYQLQGQRSDSGVVDGTVGPLTNTSRAWDVPVGGFTHIRVRATAWTSGTATVALMPQTMPYEPVPSSIDHGAVTTAAPTYTNGQNSPLSLNTAGGLRVDGSGVTQPVSGTVTANQGTAAAASGAWMAKITDGTNVAAVKPGSTGALNTDPAIVVAISPNNSLSVVSDITASTSTSCLPKTLSAAGAATTVKSSAGSVWGFALLNNNAAVVWVEFFNTTSPTLGTTAPVAAFPIPASGSLVVPIGGFALFNNATAISVAAVTAFNGSSTGSISGTVFYF